MPPEMRHNRWWLWVEDTAHSEWATDRGCRRMASESGPHRHSVIESPRSQDGLVMAPNQLTEVAGLSVSQWQHGVVYKQLTSAKMGSARNGWAEKSPVQKKFFLKLPKDNEELCGTEKTSIFPKKQAHRAPLPTLCFLWSAEPQHAGTPKAQLCTMAGNSSETGMATAHLCTVQESSRMVTS